MGHTFRSKSEHESDERAVAEEDEAGEERAGDQDKAQSLARAQIQMRFGAGRSSADVRQAAEEGLQEAPTSLPHSDRIQRSFGHHSLSGVRAHVGGRAEEASEAMGAEAFATGTDIGFRTSPDLHTTAHEAAHVVQQRGGVALKGGVGESGDHYEQHADAVADEVVAGRSAAPLLDTVASGSSSGTASAVQRKDPPQIPSSAKRPSASSLGLPKWKPPRPKGPKPKRPTRAKPKRPTKLKPPRPKGPKPKRPTGPKPKRPSKPEKIEPVIEEEILEEIPPDAEVEEEPLEEVQPDGTILTPHRVDGKWVMIEEEPLEEIEPTEEDVKASGEEVKAKTEEKVSEQGVTNAEAKDRITKGAGAVGDLAGNVMKVEKSPEPETNAPETVAPQPKKGIFSGIKNFFKGIKNIFSSRSKSEDEGEELPLPVHHAEQAPKKNPAQAASDLGVLKSKLEKRVPAIDDATRKNKPIADQVLPAAKADCDSTAEKIEPHAATRWVSHLVDIGVGIGLGFKAMAEQALMRGGIKYEDLTINSKLGKGGSDATVYNATYLNMAPMAYKVRINQDYDDPEKEDVVTKEGRMMRGFSHKNILKSGGKTDRGKTGTGYAMEKAGHGDLEGVIKKMHAADSTMTDAQRLLLMRYLMRGGFRGLNEVHKKNLVHGDIKHQNFLLGDDLEPKLMDFGVAEEEKADPKDRTRLAGTGVFMAPEVVEIGATKGVGGDVVSPALPGTGLERKSDIWSMAETILLGVFNRDSVDIVHGKGEKMKDTNKEFMRKRFGGNKWHTDLERKIRTLANSAQFEDFIKRTMQWDPKDRMTAQQCLEHKFLELTKDDKADARRLLRELLKSKAA